VDCQCEVRDEFRSRDQEEDRDDYYESINDPEKPNGPADRVIASDAVPIKKQTQRKLLPEYNCCKEYEHKSSRVVKELKQEDGADNLQRREFGKGACARWLSSSRWHSPINMTGLGRFLSNISVSALPCRSGTWGGLGAAVWGRAWLR